MTASCLHRLGFHQEEPTFSAVLSKESLLSDCDSWRVVGIICEREERGGANFGGACNVVCGEMTTICFSPTRQGRGSKCRHLTVTGCCSCKVCSGKLHG